MIINVFRLGLIVQKVGAICPGLFVRGYLFVGRNVWIPVQSGEDSTLKQADVQLLNKEPTDF